MGRYGVICSFLVILWRHTWIKSHMTSYLHTFSLYQKCLVLKFSSIKFSIEWAICELSRIIFFFEKIFLIAALQRFAQYTVSVFSESPGGILMYPSLIDVANFFQIFKFYFFSRSKSRFSAVSRLFFPNTDSGVKFCHSVQNPFS